MKKMRHLFPQYRDVIDQEKPLLQKLFKDPRSLDEIAARGKAFIKRILGDLSYFEEDALQNMHPSPKSNDMKKVLFLLFACATLASAAKDRYAGGDISLLPEYEKA